jgi:hypothetical protein
MLTFVPDTAAVKDRWFGLASKYEVKGKASHDTRMVALMLEHHIDSILTINISDFKRFNEVLAVVPTE